MYQAPYQASSYHAHAPMHQTATYQTQTYQTQWSRLGQIKLYPLASTAVDPLSNSMGTDLGGLPVSTTPITAVFADGLPVRDLPLVGGVLAASAGASPVTGTDNDSHADAANADAVNEAQPAAPATPAAPAAGAAPASWAHGRLFGPLQ